MSVGPFPASFVTWSIAASTVAAMFVQPRRIPEAIWACVGAGLLLVCHLISFTEALGAITKGYDVYLFLTGMMVLAELARRENVFDWLAGLALRAASGSRARLFTLIYLVGIAVTTVLSNDATAVVLTPAVYAVMKRAKGNPLPYVFACALIANAASFVLPISNPANLVTFDNHLPPLVTWLRIFLLPAGVAIVATYLAMRFLFRRTLQGKVSSSLESIRLSSAGKSTVLGIIVVAGVLIFCSATARSLGLPTCVTALAITLVITLWDRQALFAVGRGVSWSVLPLVAGLFVIVEALDSAGGLQLARNLLERLTEWPPLAGTLATAFGFAVASNLINNLPVGVIGASALHASPMSGNLANAMLIGIDLGPNLSVTGSLATILWLIALRRENLQVSAWSFFKVGVIVMPVALFLAGLFLSFTSPQNRHQAAEPKRSATNLSHTVTNELRQIIPRESTDTAHAISQ
ncbi:MAG TPA: arsenic transporter [Chthoniobacterales bacterium]|jgi:arsenical pump membrane protein|nr:arsenic transporter [Chthoniobacterales bacterium]